MIAMMEVGSVWCSVVGVEPVKVTLLLRILSAVALSVCGGRNDCVLLCVKCCCLVRWF